MNTYTCLKSCRLGTRTPFVTGNIYHVESEENGGMWLVGDDKVRYWFPVKVLVKYFSDEIVQKELL